MADVTVRDATSAEGGTVAAPASQPGDVLLAIVGASGSDAGSATAAGWTMAASDSASFSHAILWKVATSSEPGSYTFTGPGSFGATVAALSGADTSAPFDVAPVFASGSTGQAASPSIDIVTAGSLAVVGVAQMYSAPSAPSGMTALGSYEISYSDYYGDFSQQGMQPGPTGAENFKSSVFAWDAYALAIRPASGDGGDDGDGGDGQEGRKNWCTNPAITTGSGAGWSMDLTNGTPQSRTDLVGFARPTGVQYVRGSAAGNPAVKPPLVTSITPGQIWSPYLQLSGTNGMQLTVWFNFYDVDGHFTGPNPSSSVTFTGLDAPQAVAFPAEIAPTGVASMTLSVEGNMPAGAELLVTCVDYEQLAAEGDYITTYRDGDSPGWTWDGARGLSTSHEVTGGAAVTLIGTGAGTGSGTVTLAAQPDTFLASQAAAAGGGSVSLSTGRRLTASGAGTGSGSVELTSAPVVDITGTGAGSGTGSVAYVFQRDLFVTAAAAGSGQGAGALTTSRALSGTGEGSGSGTGWLVYGNVIVPTGTGTGGGSVRLTTARNLTGSDGAAGTGRGLIVTATSRRMSATGAGSGGGAAVLATARTITVGPLVEAGTASTVLSTGRALSSAAAQTGTGGGRISGLVVVEVAGLRPTVGLSIRLIAADSGPGEYAPDWANIQFTAIHNQGGSVTIDYAKTGINASLLLADRAEGALFDGDREIPATRFLVTQRSMDAVKEDATTATLTAPLWVPAALGKAVVYPPNWPDATPSKQRFATATPGNIMGRLIQLAQNRGAIPHLELDFDSQVDSNGQPWTYQLNLELDAGQTYSKVLSTLVEMGVAEWTCQGRTLRMLNPGTFGVDRTVQAEPVILTAGRDLLDAPEKRDAGTQLTAVLVKGDDGVWVEETDPNAPERLEGFTSQSGVADPGTLQVIGETTLQQSAAPKRELTHGLALMDPAGAQPWVDYGVADTVYRDVLGDLQALRVVQLSATYSPDGMLAGQITLGGKFDSAEVQLTRQMQALTGGSHGTAAPATDEVDTVPPATPTGLLVNSAAYIDTGGTTQTAVSADWLAVLEDADGSPVSGLDRYEVLWRRLADTTWSSAGSSRDSDLSWSPMPPGLQIEVTVRAIDRNGNASDLAEPVQHVCASDTVPPPVPTTPTVTPYLGQLKIAWDGQGLDNGSAVAMPPDFARVIVYASTEAGFIKDETTRVDNLVAAGTSVLTDLQYGTTYYVSLVAEDRAGNRSGASAEASGIPHAVGLQDITFKDRGNEVEDGSFERADMRAERTSGPWSFMEDADAPHGGWVLVADATVEPGTRRMLDLTPSVPVYEGQELYYRFTARSEDTGGDGTADTDGNIEVDLYLYDKDGGYLGAWYQRAEPGTSYVMVDGTAPTVIGTAQASTMQIKAVLLNTCTTGRWFIDAVEVRERVGTLLVQDLAVTNAKISDLEVGKLTAGTLNADVLLAGRIRTADSGSRVEMDAAGLRLSNSANVSVFAYDIGDERLDMVGRLSTSADTTQAITVDPDFHGRGAGAFPTLTFGYGVTGPAVINATAAYGDSTRTALGVNSGPTTVSGTYEQTTLYLHPDQVHLSVNSGNGATPVGGKLYLHKDGVRVQLKRDTIEAGNLAILDGGVYLEHRDTAGAVNSQLLVADNWFRLRASADTSYHPVVYGDNNSFHAGQERGADIAGISIFGTGSVQIKSNEAIQIVSMDSKVWRAVQAASFDQQSTRRAKTDIQPLPASALTAVRDASVYQWRYTGEGEGPARLGPMWEDLPDWARNPNETVSLGSLLGLTMQAVRELADDVDALRGDPKTTRKGTS